MLQYPIEEQLHGTCSKILRDLFPELSNFPPINRWAISRTQTFLPLQNSLTVLQIRTYVPGDFIYENLFPPTTIPWDLCLTLAFLKEKSLIEKMC